MSKLSDYSQIQQVLYGQRSNCRQSSFVITMQADDMGESAFNHANLLYCVCLVSYEIVKVLKPLHSGQALTDYDYFKCPKAFVLISHHPFISLFLDLL